MEKKNDRKNMERGMIFLTAILGMFLLVVSEELLYKKKQYETKINATENVWIANSQYPLNDIEIITENSFWNKTSNKISNLKGVIERKVTLQFYFRIPFVLAQRSFDKAMGLDMTLAHCAGENNPSDYGEIVLAYSNSYLGFVMDNADISENVEKLAAFGEEMFEENRNFCFFLVPEKLAGNIAYPDYSEEKQEEIKHVMQENKLDMVCIPDLMAVNEMDMESLFFKTDHHWLPSAGIWADKILCETLNQKYGYRFDTSVFDMDNYETTILEDYFLGCQGKKVTEVYCEREDFPIVLPLYETELEVFISGKNETLYGSIAETLFDDTVLEQENIYLRDNYSFYGYGDQALISIHNNRIHDGSHILMIKVSYADVMYPYLAAVVENLDVIDLRKFDGSLKSYIEESNPDTVIVVYGAGIFEGTGGQPVTFDFR